MPERTYLREHAGEGREGRITGVGELTQTALGLELNPCPSRLLIVNYARDLDRERSRSRTVTNVNPNSNPNLNPNPNPNP